MPVLGQVIITTLIEVLFKMLSELPLLGALILDSQSLIPMQPNTVTIAKANTKQITFVSLAS